MMSSMKRHERMVFVDPDDESLPYWWPAVVSNIDVGNILMEM